MPPRKQLLIGSLIVSATVVGWLLYQRYQKSNFDLRESTKNCKEENAKTIARKHGIVACNFHFTRKCNFKCGFCFHTAKTSHVESLEDLKRILYSLRAAGIEKINFAGGEPLLPDYRRILTEMLKYAKLECKFDSVSIISNGYYAKENFFKDNAEYIDILGVSCDSARDETNDAIGRGKGGGHAARVKTIAKLCAKYGVTFKLNTVVNAYNQDEDMIDFVKELNPARWKIFQVLPLQGENSGEGALRQVDPFLIDATEFQAFVNRHQPHVSPDVMKVEDNSTMKASYLLVDEFGCFLDSSTGAKVATRSILQVGIEAALTELLGSAGGGFDAAAFTRRDGKYEWSKKKKSGDKKEERAAESTVHIAGGCGSGIVTCIDMEDI